jgi:hypothetical protein
MRALAMLLLVSRGSCALRGTMARSSRVLASSRVALAASPSCAASMVATAPAKSLAHLGTHGEHPAFELVRGETVDEYGALCGLYRHKRTGAELLSVIADEPNKVFGITFRTPPVRAIASSQRARGGLRGRRLVCVRRRAMRTRAGRCSPACVRVRLRARATSQPPPTRFDVAAGLSRA